MRMYKKSCLIILSSIVFAGAYCTPEAQEQSDNPLSFSTKSTWKEFEQAKDSKFARREKSVLVNEISIKSKQATTLKSITLKWEGKRLPSISAALYEKRHDADELLPIEKNLICDGKWSPKNQEITFTLDKKIIALNSFFLVLNFKKRLEKKIKAGSFKLPAVVAHSSEQNS